MINLLIDKIYLYNSKVEIYYKYQRTKSPDDKHQGFLFYQNIEFYQKTRVVKNDYMKKPILKNWKLKLVMRLFQLMILQCRI